MSNQIESNQTRTNVIENEHVNHNNQDVNPIVPEAIIFQKDFTLQSHIGLHGFSIILISILAIFVLSVGAYYLLNLQGKSNGNVEKSFTETPLAGTLSTFVPATPTGTSEADLTTELNSRSLSVKQTEYPDEWIKFTSKLVKMSFEYPAIWGDVEEVLIEPAQSEYTNAKGYWSNVSLKKGKMYQLRFSNLSYPQYFPTTMEHINTAFAIGYSEDIELFSYGGECENLLLRDKEMSEGVTSKANSFTYANSCSQLYVGTTCQPHEAYNGAIYFSTVENEITFVRLYIPTISKFTYEKIISSLDHQTYCFKEGSSSEIDYSENKVFFPRATVREKEIKQQIQNNLFFDEESIVRMEIYKRMLNSAKLY